MNNVRKFNNFNDRILATGNGIDISKKTSIQVEYVGGVQKNITTDRIDNLPANTIQDYQKIRDEKLECELQEKNRVIYSNIMDDRFIENENELFGKDLQEKAQYYKNQTNYGHNGAIQGFGQRDRNIRQLSNAFDSGLDKAKKVIGEKTLYGNFNVSLDEKEENEKAAYYLKHLQLNKPKPQEKKKLNFDKIMEMQTREQLGLMNGRRPDISDVVKQRVDEYNKITTNKSNALISNNVGGFFCGGFNRRKMLNKVQVNGNAMGEISTEETMGEIDENSYYNQYGHGSEKIQSALIDLIKKNESQTKLNGVL
jgi:predicted esterase YcpF (UPF0227 family)